MDLAEFIRRLTNLSKKGFVESHRSGDTGVGKTLEDLLGIEENNISGPDFGYGPNLYELKSTRRKSKTMITLFTKAPSPKGAIKQLVVNFGYPAHKSTSNTKQLKLVDDDEEDTAIHSRSKELHVTLDAIKPNSVGLQLKFVGDRLYFKNSKGVQAYYDRDVLKESFEKKYCRLIYVIADSKKMDGKEFFWYNEAYKLDGFGFSTFAQLIRDGFMKVDIRVGHYPDGRRHDHGTGFRILPVYLPRCFEVIECILESPKANQSLHAQ
ncbi:MAG: MvaI/BcnI family restriction endonuclease [Candidatus Thorarchaeota archaeon]